MTSSREREYMHTNWQTAESTFSTQEQDRYHLVAGLFVWRLHVIWTICYELKV